MKPISELTLDKWRGSVRPTKLDTIGSHRWVVVRVATGKFLELYRGTVESCGAAVPYWGAFFRTKKEAVAAIDLTWRYLVDLAGLPRSQAHSCPSCEGTTPDPPTGKRLDRIPTKRTAQTGQKEGT
jgi:hypothetical protein